MDKYFLFLIFLLLPACTIYTEKQSEALSKVVYASKDSMDAARIDLADRYITEAVRVVKPPKNRIKVESVYQKGASQHINAVASSSGRDPVPANKQRMVIIPEKYRADTVVVVSSEEYQKLLRDKEVFAQIQKDNESLVEAKLSVDNELIRQTENRDKMINDLNIMQKKIVEKDLVILQRNVVIVLLLAAIACATYLRIKGVL
jgi:hypothetical protein